MTNSDKFSVHHSWYTVNLRCDVCEGRSWGSGEIFAWSDEDAMNLAGLVSRAQAHWAKFHEKAEDGN